MHLSSTLTQSFFSMVHAKRSRALHLFDLPDSALCGLYDCCDAFGALRSCRHGCPPSLQWLDASCCSLKEVPVVLESLPNLTRHKLHFQDVEVRVLRPLLPLISSCANLKVLAIGGIRWSPASLAHITQLLQHSEAEGRSLDFCYHLEEDRSSWRI